VLPGEHVSAPPGLRVEEVVGNVADAASLSTFCGRADGGMLFHLGIIHPPRVKDFYSINYEGTVNTVNAARAAGVRRAIVISSNCPFGANPSPWFRRSRGWERRAGSDRRPRPVRHRGR
jgi:nucleoside-diphosphate-sugar epimerase